MAASPPPASASPPFQPGDEVEVTMINDGFHGAWYKALVYSRDAAGLYLVVYKALADAADVSQHLREVVPGSQLHPRPPATKLLPLTLDQPIEAFYNDGWRPEVVWKLPGQQGVRDYEVLFMGTEEKFKYRARLLRKPLASQRLAKISATPRWDQEVAQDLEISALRHFLKFLVIDLPRRKRRRIGWYILVW